MMNQNQRKGQNQGWRGQQGMNNFQMNQQFNQNTEFRPNNNFQNRGTAGFNGPRQNSQSPGHFNGPKGHFPNQNMNSYGGGPQNFKKKQFNQEINPAMNGGGFNHHQRGGSPQFQNNGFNQHQGGGFNQHQGEGFNQHQGGGFNQHQGGNQRNNSFQGRMNNQMGNQKKPLCKNGLSCPNIQNCTFFHPKEHFAQLGLIPMNQQQSNKRGPNNPNQNQGMSQMNSGHYPSANFGAPIPFGNQPSPNQGVNRDQPNGNQRRCKFGATCPHLPNCTFFHPPEEVRHLNNRFPMQGNNPMGPNSFAQGNQGQFNSGGNIGFNKGMGNKPSGALPYSIGGNVQMSMGGNGQNFQGFSGPNPNNRGRPNQMNQMSEERNQMRGPSSHSREQRPCNFGLKCNKLPNCPFYHPPEHFQQHNQGNNFSSGMSIESGMSLQNSPNYPSNSMGFGRNSMGYEANSMGFGGISSNYGPLSSSMKGTTSMNFGGLNEPTSKPVPMMAPPPNVISDSSEKLRNVFGEDVLLTRPDLTEFQELGVGIAEWEAFWNESGACFYSNDDSKSRTNWIERMSQLEALATNA